MDDLVDQIYETAFVPEAWPSTLWGISSISGSSNTAFFMFAEGEPARGRCEELVKPLFDEFIAGDNWKTSTSVQRTYEANPAGFVVVDDLLTPEEVESDAIRRQLREFGMGTCAATTVTLPSGEIVSFVVQRWLKDGGFDRRSIGALDRIRPHLARTALIAARLRLARVQTTVDVLGGLGLPAAVLSGSGRTLASNALFEGCTHLLRPAAFDRIRFLQPSIDRLFQEALATTCSSNDAAVRSIAIKATGEHAATVIHVLPIRRAAHDILPGADCLVLATEVAQASNVPHHQLLHALFDLSPSEARLAAQLAAGKTLKESGGAMGITAKSARTYLDRIFTKTGTHQQSALVSLLKSAGNLSGGP